MDKDVYYFPHDYNARSDPKILAMRSVYKAEGYGWYWMIVENLRAQPGYRLPINDLMLNGLAMDLHCERIQLEQFIKDCVERFKDSEGSLFETDGESIWSNSLLRRMDVYDLKSAQAREAARMRWQSERSTDAKPEHSEGNASRVKKSRVKKSKVKKSKEKDPASPSGDFINQLLTVFGEEYEAEYGHEFLDLYAGKYRAAVGALLKIHKEQAEKLNHPPPNSEETKAQFRTFFRAAVKVDDKWIHSKMSPLFLRSNLNEILRKIDNGTAGSSKGKLDGNFFEKLHQATYGGREAGRN